MSQPKPVATNTVSSPPLPCVAIKQLDWREPWPKTVHTALTNLCTAKRIDVDRLTLADRSLLYTWCLNHRTRYLILFYEMIRLGYRLPDLPAGRVTCSGPIPAPKAANSPPVQNMIAKIRKDSNHDL